MFDFVLFGASGTTVISTFGPEMCLTERDTPPEGLKYPTRHIFAIMFLFSRLCLDRICVFQLYICNPGRVFTLIPLRCCLCFTRICSRSRLWFNCYVCLPSRSWFAIISLQSRSNKAQTSPTGTRGLSSKELPCTCPFDAYCIL